jgi:hypothetical protein
MKRFLLAPALSAPALSALAMFVLGAAFWMSPFPYRALTPVADNVNAAALLGQIFPRTGVYMVPGPEIKDQKLLEELWQRGPSAKVDFIREGHPVMEPAVFLRGYLHYFVVSFLLATLLSGVVSSLPTYGGRVRFCALVGLAGAVLITLSDPIWWHHPWAWNLVNCLYAFLAFLAGGLVLARFIRPASS